MTLYLAPTSNGIGSLISNIPAIQALVSEGRAPYLVLRSPEQQSVSKLIDGLAGVVLESDFEQIHLPSGDSFINLRDHPLQTDHVWGSDEFFAKFPNIYFEDIFQTICHDKGIEISYEQLRPLKHRLSAAAQGKVVFVPGSNGRQKCWPADHFLALAKKLEQAGLSCTVVGEPQRSESVKALLDAGLDWLETPTFTDAVDAVSSSRAVVSVDTGLMHVAIHQGVATVGLFRAANMILRQRAHTRYLAAPRCAQECLDSQFAHVTNKKVKFDSSAGLSANEFYWLRWNCVQSEAERCMAQITVEHVFDALLSLPAVVN